MTVKADDSEELRAFLGLLVDAVVRHFGGWRHVQTCADLVHADWLPEDTLTARRVCRILVGQSVLTAATTSGWLQERTWTRPQAHAEQSR